MTGYSLSRYERCAVWLVALGGLLRLTILALEAPTEGTTPFIISSLSAAGVIPETGMRGTGGGSPSSGSSPTSGSTFSSSVGSSTETVSSIPCKTKRIKRADGCSDLIVECNGYSYWELFACEDE